jgi:hypothetical protein
MIMSPNDDLSPAPAGMRPAPQAGRFAFKSYIDSLQAKRGYSSKPRSRAKSIGSFAHFARLQGWHRNCLLDGECEPPRANGKIWSATALSVSKDVPQ